MKTAPQTLAQALDVIRAMHNALLAFRNPEFDLVAPGREGDFDDRVKAVLAHSAPVIKSDRAIAAHEANPVIVDARAKADDMNRLHGERYGFDWVYPDIDPGPDSHASAVLYPAIKRAMDEIDLDPLLCSSVNVKRAYNDLFDAFWSETPAPASEAAKRRHGVPSRT